MSLMVRSRGQPGLAVGLIDGPVASGHPDLAAADIRAVAGADGATCAVPPGEACGHGTFIAGILVGRRGSPAPSICPDCTLLVSPIFRDIGQGTPVATPEQVAQAITACVAAGARVLNISASTSMPSTRADRELEGALDFAAHNGVLVVAAAGNQATLGSWVITRHPWVIPVAGCDGGGRPTWDSNLGFSVGRRGLGAPADGVRSLSPEGTTRTSGGTSCAAAFVTGTAALLWSVFPSAGANDLRRALIGGPRRSVTPPLLDAESAYVTLLAQAQAR